ncbi:unnamed protein product [Coffea canephora]|uniref:Uncharacterized protein n=2 Tax=Coffea TaxID=13442 RepID=A0A068TWF9_COFCA|nr:unnamed protein product [Coffea canephora]
MSTTNSQILNLWGVLSESKRIINAHSRHFLALSVIFLLPLSFSLIIYPTLQSTFLSSDSLIPQQSLFISSPYASPHPTTAQFLLPLVYTLFVLLLSLLAVATITYSTFHGFYGRPVKLMSSFKSTLYSFLPLVSSFLVSQFIVALIISLLGLFAALIYKSLQLYGLDMDFDSKYFLGFSILVAIMVGLVLVWLQVNWSLGSVVVVVESKWGFEPLQRSYYLLSGMKRVALSMLLFYGLAIGLLVWGCSTSVANAGQASGWWRWTFVLQTVVSSAFITLLMLHNVAANVVLYMYCKALHGELAFEIAEEFACQYVSLPFDCQKVPHIVSVVEV